MRQRCTFLAVPVQLAAVGLWLSACAVGPDFEKPEAPKVSGYTSGAALDKTAEAHGVAQKFVTGEASAAWWRLYKSEALNKLVDQALTNNPNLQAAEASLEAAQQNLYAGWGSFGPSITGSGSGSRNKGSGKVATSTDPKGSIYNLYNSSVNVSYTLDLFGGTRRMVEGLDATVDAQRFVKEGTYLSLTANVVTAAVREASLRGQLEAMNTIIDAQRKQLELVQKQFDLGAVARSAVLAQEAALAQNEATLPELENQLSQTRHALGALAGAFPSDEISAQFTLDSLTLPEEIPVSLPSQLVAQRPDIQVAEAQLHAASAAIGVATAAMLPQITLTASLGSAAQKFGDFLTPGAGLWSLAGGVAQPLFEGGALMHKRGAAKAEFEAAAASYRATVLAAFQNVADSLKALDYDARTLKAQTVSEKAAADSLALTESQFKRGAVSYIALLNAQQAYQQARIALVKARAARLADTAALFQALGGGWWNRVDADQETKTEQGAVASANAAPAETKTVQDGDKQ